LMNARQVLPFLLDWNFNKLQKKLKFFFCKLNILMKNSPKIRKKSRKLERFARFSYLVQVGSQKYGMVFKFYFHILVIIKFG
jgi:hypothetical protein